MKHAEANEGIHYQFARELIVSGYSIHAFLRIYLAVSELLEFGDDNRTRLEFALKHSLVRIHSNWTDEVRAAVFDGRTNTDGELSGPEYSEALRLRIRHGISRLQARGLIDEESVQRTLLIFDDPADAIAIRRP